jgi:hypothetical protein
MSKLGDLLKQRNLRQSPAITQTADTITKTFQQSTEAANAIESTASSESLTDPIKLLSSSPSLDSDDLYLRFEQDAEKFCSSSPSAEPEETLFIAAWTPFLLSPYFLNTLERREYIRWLLSPSYYVLNTFPQTDMEALFALFMEKNPPKIPQHLHQLWLLLSDIYLFVPAKYEEGFKAIISSK